MRGPNGERLGDPLEGEDQRERPVALIVVGEDGERRPGWALRAGDYIEKTAYDHPRRVMEVHTRPATAPLPLLTRLRRWWEGRDR